jgi:hypothetical protein
MWVYLLGIIQEYLVITNIYNGDIIPKIPVDIQYSIPDIFILIAFFMKNDKYSYYELISICSAFIAHIQWYFHSPFSDWPSWWYSTKSYDDIRHRTEYYDTHVMCFTIYSILFYNFIQKNNNTNNIDNIDDNL